MSSVACAHCGSSAEPPGNLLLLVGVVGVGLRCWLHACCWAPFRQRQSVALEIEVNPLALVNRGELRPVKHLDFRPAAMVALDLYCGSGGAALGLKQAGFAVVGVDLHPQPHYTGDVFIRADAITYLKTADLSRFNFIWASPPCQAYSILRHAPGRHRSADLVAPTRELLAKTGLPFVIENVPGAPLIRPALLCGSMFGLGAGGYQLQRHRLFESNFPLEEPSSCKHAGPTLGIYGAHVRDRRRAKGTNHKSGSNLPWEYAFHAMGVPEGTMTLAELSESIPAIYSRYIAETWLRSPADGASSCLPARGRQFELFA